MLEGWRKCVKRGFGRDVKINPADKARFGESSVGHIYQNAYRVAREVGIALEVTAERVAIGDFVMAKRGDAVETPWGKYNMDDVQWEALTIMVLNHFASYKRPPDRAELEQFLAAVGVLDS